MRTSFTLAKQQRQRLLAGDYRPLMCEVKPAGCEPGANYVLTWFREQHGAADEVRYTIPRGPSCYLTVTKVVRHQRGGWLIRFDVTDKRSPARFLRASPPVWVPTKDQRDTETSSTVTEESFYTASRWAAIDELEAVPREWQKRFSKLASERDHKLREQKVAEANKARWAAKRRRRRQRWIEDAA